MFLVLGLLFVGFTVWLNSIFILPLRVIATAELHFSPQLSCHHMMKMCHNSGLICSYVNWSLMLCVFVPVILWKHDSVLCCWVCFRSKIILTNFLILLSTSLFCVSLLLCPPATHLCPPLRFPRCKQVHAPLIPAPAGPPQRGAVWSNGGHGTRRSFWIQSIQKRPGAFLAEF